MIIQGRSGGFVWSYLDPEIRIKFVNSGAKTEQLAFQLDVDAQMSRDSDDDKNISIASSTKKAVATICKGSEDPTLTHRPVGEARG